MHGCAVMIYTARCAVMIYSLWPMRCNLRLMRYAATPRYMNQKTTPKKGMVFLVYPIGFAPLAARPAEQLSIVHFAFGLYGA